MSGDFADQAGVPLPPSYLTFETTDAGVARVTSTGELVGVSRGLALLSVERAGLQAVTNVVVGDLLQNPTAAEVPLITPEYTGLYVYPAGVTLAFGQTRQIVTSLSPDFTVDTQLVSQFFVDHSGVAKVDETGLITAVGPGEAIVTVINGTQERVILVAVQDVHAGATVIGAGGGAVNGVDGSLVAISPFALREAVEVSIAPVSADDLPLQVPAGFAFAGDFQLDVGDDALRVPAQIAVPVSPVLAPGTTVHFWRLGQIPDENGVWSDYWLQVDSGVVGDDGFARTASPPYSGVNDSGGYLVTTPAGSVAVVQGKLNVSFNVPIAMFGIIPLNPFSPPGLPPIAGAVVTGINAASDLSDVVGGPSLPAPGPLTSFVPFMSVSIDISKLRIIAVPKVGLPFITTLDVQLQAGQLNTFEVTIPAPEPASGDPSLAPIVEAVHLELVNDGGQDIGAVVLEGQRFVASNPMDPLNLGGALSDLKVEFVLADGKVLEGQILSSLSLVGFQTDKLYVRPPDSVAVGQSEIRVVRPYRATTVLPGSTSPTLEEVTHVSNSVRLAFNEEYVFTALSAADQVAVIDNSQVADPSQQPLIARFPVGISGANDSPQSIALAPDLDRGYAMLRNTGSVAVFDTMALHQIDALTDDLSQADTLGLNMIELRVAEPGATPFWGVAHPNGDYLYVSDYRDYQETGIVYVVDTNPASSTYHRVVQKIQVQTAGVGLRQMAINSTGTRLYVTAPNRDLFRTPASDDSQIIVINVDPDDHPAGGANANKWHEQIGIVQKAPGEQPYDEAYGIASTNQPGVMTFTNRMSDSAGFGVIEVQNDSPTGFQATARTIQLQLGSFSDYFDVNSAQSVVVTKDLQYAFVTGYNHFIQGVASRDPFVGGIPGGSNIGIIQDPLGNPRLIAATRPIPAGFANHVVLSPDDRYLYASFRGPAQSVFVFDVQEMIDAIEDASSDDLAGIPIDELDPGTASAIDVRANYTVLPGFDFAKGQFTFGVPEGALNGPIGVGGNPQGMAATPAILVPSLFNNLTDQFFFSDDGSFVVSFENGSSPGNGNGDIELEIDTNSFLIGSPKGYETVLNEQQIKTMNVQVQQMEQDMHNAAGNVLFGSRINAGAVPATGGQRLLEKAIYVYRLFDATDSDPKDGRIEFEKTFADGPDKNLQEKIFKFEHGSDVNEFEVKPVMTITGPNAQDFRLLPEAIYFDPRTPLAPGQRQMRNATLEIRRPGSAPTEPFIGVIQLRGEAIGPQLVHLPASDFRDALKDYIAGVPGLPSGFGQEPDHLDKLVSQAFPNPTTQPAAFQVAVTAFLADLQTLILNKFKEVDARASDTDTDLSDGDAFLLSLEESIAANAQAMKIDFKSNNVVTGDEFTGGIAVRDFDADKWLAIKQDFAANKISMSQAKFRFDQITNAKPDDVLQFTLPNGTTITRDGGAEVSIRFAVEHVREQQDNGTPRPPSELLVEFAEVLANVITHEIGHTLGAVHVNSDAWKSLSNVMGKGGASRSPNGFALERSPQIKLALGLEVRGEFDKTYVDYTQTNLNAGTASPSPVEDINAPILTVLDGPLVVGASQPNLIDGRTSIDLGSVVAGPAGGQSSAVTLYLTSGGDQDLVITGLTIAGHSGFSIEGLGSLPLTLPPIDFADPHPAASTLPITVRFDPDAIGFLNAVLRIESNSLHGSLLEIPLTGRGVSQSGDLIVEVPNNNIGGLAVAHDPARWIPLPLCATGAPAR